MLADFLALLAGTVLKTTLNMFSSNFLSSLKIWITFSLNRCHLSKWLEYPLTSTRIILCMRPANERWRYIVTLSLIGWVHTQNDPCFQGIFVFDLFSVWDELGIHLDPGLSLSSHNHQHNHISMAGCSQSTRWPSQQWIRRSICIHDVQFSCAITQPLLAHHWRVHQCLLTSRFTASSIPWGASAPGGKSGSSFLRTITFLIIHRFLSLKVLLWYICFWRSTAYNTFQFEKSFLIWWKVLDTIILWQDAGPCCEQTHAALEVGSSLDQGQGVYSGRSDVVGSSQVRLCHTCIIDVMYK